MFLHWLLESYGCFFNLALTLLKQTLTVSDVRTVNNSELNVTHESRLLIEIREGLKPDH